jgi:hypothetical protein
VCHIAYLFNCLNVIFGFGQVIDWGTEICTPEFDLDQNCAAEAGFLSLSSFNVKKNLRNLKTGLKYQVVSEWLLMIFGDAGTGNAPTWVCRCKIATFMRN